MSTVLSIAFAAAAAFEDALVAAVASSSPAKDKTCSTRPCCSGIVFITTTTSSFFSVCDPANAFHLLCSPALPSPALIDPFRGKEHRQAHSFDRKTEGKKFGVHRSVSPAVVDSDTRYDSGTGSQGDPSLSSHGTAITNSNGHSLSICVQQKQWQQQRRRQTSPPLKKSKVSIIINC